VLVKSSVFLMWDLLSLDMGVAGVLSLLSDILSPGGGGTVGSLGG
jgi:hypothetical protein